VLNLSRTVGEVVRIGDDIEVQVERITGNCVRLGFKAPREVRIYRDEVYRQRASARVAAAGAAATPRGGGARRIPGLDAVAGARPHARVAGRKHRDR
jgi:carbon storage regulator